MEISTTVTVLSTLSSLLGLALLGFWAFRQFYIDEFRQNVFRLRDELFDYARVGNIAFDHPAYITLRSLMNGYIRFSERISLIHFLCVSLMTHLTNHEYPNKFSAEWERTTAPLDEETKAKLEEFRQRASLQLFHYLFISSFVKKAVVIAIGITFLLIAALLKGRVVIAYLKKKLARPNGVDALAYDYTTQHSARVRESLDVFDTSAVAFGRV